MVRGVKDYFALITTFNQVVIAEVFERVAPEINFHRISIEARKINTKYDAKTVARLSDLIMRKYPGAVVMSKDKHWMDPKSPK